MRAIVLDNTLKVSRRAQYVLAPMGVQVVLASSLQETATFATGEQSDLLIINLTGEMTTWQVAAHLRRAHFKGKTMIICDNHLAAPGLVDLRDLPAVECASRPASHILLDRLLEKAASHAILDRPPMAAPDPVQVHGMVGKSKPMRDIFSWIDKVAPSDASVCLYGESGTGKELVARALHQASPRRDRPLVTLDCTAVPDGLMESHLFGHVRGAFTGAVETREGVFSLAHTGTLFIDELCELSLPLQAKLLRVIQSREFVKVGGTKPIRTDIRLITATNKDPKKEVEKGTFRQDLYYRVAVVMATIPPLRERKEDIPLLVEYFLRKFSLLDGKPARNVAPSLMDRLISSPWPGNVRQLEHFIEQAVVLADGVTLTKCDLPDAAPGAGTSRNVVALLSLEPRLPLREVERRYILDTLQHVRGNRGQAAKILGISVRCLQYKVKEYRLDRGSIAAAPCVESASRVMQLRSV